MGGGGRVGGGLGLTLRFSASLPRMSISALMCAPTLRSDSAARKRLTEMRVIVVGIPGGPDDDDAYEGTGDINSYSVRSQAGGGANTYLPKTITANLRARART